MSHSLQLTVFGILAVSAFIGILVHAAGKAPLWPWALCLAMIECLRIMPLGN